MLILSRRADESIVIGDDIEITILEIKGKSVKIGVNAPRELSVYRLELYVKLNTIESDVDTMAPASK